MLQTQCQANAPVAPRDRRSESKESDGHKISMSVDLFGTVNQVDRLSPHSRGLAYRPAARAVFGAETKVQVANDVGDLLRKSISSQSLYTTAARFPA